MAINRRNFLKLMGASGLALANLDSIQQVLAHRPPGTFLPAHLLERDSVHHIVSRLAFGPTDALLNHVGLIGVDAFIEEQLHPENIPDDEIEYLLRPFDMLTMQAGDIVREYQGETGIIVFQLIASTVLRALFSNRQLYERMVHFWTDHFSILLLKSPGIYLKFDDDRDVIRQHALGSFRDLLGASAKSPAMLVYLDNADSAAEAPNENYARELLELHTLGVDGGYTEEDVREVARCFTGWTVARPQRNRDAQVAFQFSRQMHDDGEKVVLGHTIPAGGGQKDGEMVLDILAQHPSTARFVSEKLLRRFVADEPPESLVSTCAQTFLQTEGDIRSVLRIIFVSDEFRNAPPKFKRPFEYTLSVLRAMNYEIDNMRELFRALQEALSNMGHVPFLRPSPDGYPDVQTEWTDTLLMRWNIAIAAAGGDLPGASGSLLPVLETHNIPLEAEPIIRFMGNYLYGREFSPEEEVILTEFFENSSDNVEAIQSAIALLMCAPAFQYR